MCEKDPHRYWAVDWLHIGLLHEDLLYLRRVSLLSRTAVTATEFESFLNHDGAGTVSVLRCQARCACSGAEEGSHIFA